MEELLIEETEHAAISQAHGIHVPGYLIVQTLRSCARLSELTPEEQVDLTRCLARAEELVAGLVDPDRVYVLKFGEENPQIHFHVVPRTREIERAYLDDVDDQTPCSGARIVDWIWTHHETLGHTRAEITDFVQRAREHLARASSDVVSRRLL